MTEQQAHEFSAALGAEIAYWRRRRGLSREQLGAAVGLSLSTIGRIERGSEDAAASSPDVWRIARTLGLSFTDLVRRSEDAAGLSDLSATPDLDAEPMAALDGDEDAGAPEGDGA